MDINEIRKENSEEYAAVLRDLRTYAQMEQNGRNFLEEGIALNNVREKLLQEQNINNNKLLEMNGQKPELVADKQVQQRKQIIEKKQKVLQRYSLYFDTFCMGQLKVEGAGPLKKKYDYRDKELNATDNTKAIFQMKDVSNIPLFTHEPSINDIHQKYLGDCYLEAALGSLVSEHPERVKELMKDNGDGTVTVCLYKNYTSIKDLPEKLSPQLRQARKSSQKQNFKTMSNYDIMLQLFGRFKGNGDDHYALEKKRQEDTSEELKRINDERKRLSEEFEKPIVRSDIFRPMGFYGTLMQFNALAELLAERGMESRLITADGSMPYMKIVLSEDKTPLRVYCNVLGGENYSGFEWEIFCDISVEMEQKIEESMRLNGIDNVDILSSEGGKSILFGRYEETKSFDVTEMMEQFLIPFLNCTITRRTTFIPIKEVKSSPI